MKKFFCFGKDDFCDDTNKCFTCDFCNCSGGEEREAIGTNADHIRSMTDEELAAALDGYGAYSVCDLVCGGKCYAIASLEKTASQKCREIILAKLREPYKEKEHGQTIGTDAEA